MNQVIVERFNQERLQHRLSVCMRQEVRRNMERQIYREHDEEIREALRIRSASDYLKETK